MRERLKWKLFEDKSCELVRNPKCKAGQRGIQVVQNSWMQVGGELNVSLRAKQKKLRSLQDLFGLADPLSIPTKRMRRGMWPVRVIT